MLDGTKRSTKFSAIVLRNDSEENVVAALGGAKIRLKTIERPSWKIALSRWQLETVFLLCH